MKIGTAPKITAGAIGIIALIFIGFIGVRQMTAPNVEERVYLSPWADGVERPRNNSEELAAQTDSAQDTGFRDNQSQNSAAEIDPNEVFFNQSEETDTAQFTTDAEFEIETDPDLFADISALLDDKDQLAEDVMNAYVSALQNVDIEGMRSLSTGRTKEGLGNAAADGFPIFNPDELKDGLKDLPVEMRETAEQQMQMIEHQMRSGMFEQQIRRMALKFISQAEVIRSEYIGDEFHFELGAPTPDMSEIPGIEFSKVTAPNELYKMRKENGVWRIYDNETLD